MSGETQEPVLVPMKQALGAAGISRATFFRWVKEGRIPDARFRDRNRYRVFTLGEIENLKGIAGKFVDTSEQLPIPFRRR